MKVTFPHMGNMWICLKTMLEQLGVETVVPPPITRKTLDLGSRHAPEFACMPLKLNLGNFIEARELGADTIIMAGGCGPCRFGYYAQVEYEILTSLGIDYNLVVLEPPEKHVGELLAKIRHITGGKSWLKVIRAVHFGFKKARVIDTMEKTALRIRPVEASPGLADRILDAAVREVEKADSYREIEMASRCFQDAADAVPKVESPYARVGLVGEIYTLLEPFANMDIEKKLGRLGIEVDRAIFLSEWANDHLFMGLFRGLRSTKDYVRASYPYLNHFVGGHGQETLGSSVCYRKSGYDGIIQVLPFTCMPEIVALSILPSFSRDTGMPVMTLIMDEQTGEAGMMTRLEAFADLLEERKTAKRRVS